MRNTFGKRAIGLAAGALAATMLLGACGGTSTAPTSGSTETGGSTGGGASGGAVNIALQGDITTYDPWSAQSGFNGSLWSNVALYDSLVHLDEKGEPTPWLATEWTSEDSSHYSITLRDDVKFTDGTALNADAVVKNFEYAQVASTPGECNSYIKGVTATATSDTTVDFALETPSVGFMTDLGMCASFIVNPVALENPDSLKTTPAGSGPYVLDASSVAGQKWVYTRNADYWAADQYPFDTVNLTFFQDAAAAANAAQAGQIDLIQSVDAARDTSGLATILTSTDFRGLMFQDITGKITEPLGDVRVRQAMQMAIDRQALQESLYPDSGEVGYSTPFTSTSEGFTDALKSTYAYDPEKAKHLLAEAGYSDGFTVKAMIFPGLYGDASQAISGQLAEVGITLELSDQSADFFNQLKSGTWAMNMFNWTIGTNPVHTYEGLSSPTGFWNHAQNTSPAIDGLLVDLAQAKDDAERKPILENIAKTFQEESWYIAPVLVRGATAYNDQLLSVSHTQGAPTPFLYQVKKVG